jgi:hypothetical protein
MRIAPTNITPLKTGWQAGFGTFFGLAIAG